MGKFNSVISVNPCLTIWNKTNLMDELTKARIKIRNLESQLKDAEETIETLWEDGSW